MLLGDLEGPTARIDRAGRLFALDDSWRVEWAVGTGDRWRIVDDERAVRQHRIDDTPAYETWLRVPGGDVIARAAAANDGVSRSVVLEFENASPDGVVIAVAGRVSGLVVGDADGITVDDRCWLRPARPAGGVVVGDGDPWPDTTSEPTAAPASATGDDIGAALLVPLPHLQRIAVVVAVEGEAPSQLPVPAEIAAGWRSVVDQAMHLELPDPDMVEAWRRIVCDLVVAAGSDDLIAAGEAAGWLDVAGLPGEADRARAALVEAATEYALTSSEAVVAMRALASRDLNAGQASGLAELAGVLAEIAGHELDRSTLELVAEALRPTDGRAADDALRLAVRATTDDRAPASAAASAAATIIDRVQGRADSHQLQLLPVLPVGWRGQPIDVRGLITPAGTVSFSVRWHGERPAVLWERSGGSGSEPTTMSFPGLDQDWSSTDSSGEALLAAPVDP